jgi:hypothetical protein
MIQIYGCACVIYYNTTYVCYVFINVVFSYLHMDMFNLYYTSQNLPTLACAPAVTSSDYEMTFYFMMPCLSKDRCGSKIAHKTLENDCLQLSHFDKNQSKMWTPTLTTMACSACNCTTESNLTLLSGKLTRFCLDFLWVHPHGDKIMFVDWNELNPNVLLAEPSCLRCQLGPKQTRRVTFVWFRNGPSVTQMSGTVGYRYTQ